MSITIQPRNVFGLRSDVLGNINFTTKQEVIYPVAGVLAIHDYRTGKQKFLRFAERSRPQIICMSPNKKLLAVGECLDNNCHVNIYDLATLKRRKTLQFPDEVPTKETQALAFTHDSKGVAVLSRDPEAFLVIFYLDKADTIVIGRVSNGNNKQLVAKYISCNSSDTGLVVVGGDNTYKVMSRQDKGFTCQGTMTGDNRFITSVMWLTPDIVVAGTSLNELLFVEGGDLKLAYPAELIEVIDLSKSKEEENEQIGKLLAAAGVYDHFDVNCLTLYAKGFVYAIENVLHVFEKETGYKFSKKTRITIPVDIFPVRMYRITNVSINVLMDTVIVTAAHNQIYIGMLIVPETLKVKDLVFQKLGEPLHIDGIVSMSVCSWKSIIMTAAKDQTIRIWNYDSGNVELVKKYQVDVTCVALHPSGIFVAVGFNDQLRLMEILLDDLKLVKTFNFPKCKAIEFSHQGHMLACAYEALVTIVSVFTFDTIRTFKAHNGCVLTLQWSQDDTQLVTAGEDGAIYNWCVRTGKRNNESVQKGTEYRGLVVLNDVAAIYAVTDAGCIRQMVESDINREIKVSEGEPLNCIALARSEMVMFTANDRGDLYNVQAPIMDANGGKLTNYRFFDGAVTTMKITYNDMLLATGSADGTLVIWSILNNEGRIAPMCAELGQCMDVMIPRRVLMDRIETIAELQRRIEQQVAEFQYQLRQGAAFHSEQMRDIHSGYCAAIEDLKEKNDRLQEQHIEEFNIITENIAETKEQHAKTLADMETDFHEKVIIEFEKSASIKKQMDDMREDYEHKLRKSAGCLQDTIEALETDFKKQLQERQELIRQLMQEMESKKAEFVEFCRQVEIDNDRKMVETKLHYEQRLKEENDAMLKWRADAGVLNKKYNSVSRNCDELEKEKAVLRSEHHKTQGVIRNFHKDISELKKEIEDRDNSIRDKEKRVNDLQKKNQELEKYKQVLNHKIVELKAQIEPREREIKENKDQISDMERELEGLEYNNLQFELQLNDLKDKFHSIEKELKMERSRCRASRSHVQRICGDIYHLSGFIHNAAELKTQTMRLFHLYSDDKTLKRSLEQDEDVDNEFLRQRDHLEKMLENYRLKEKKVETNNSAKMIMENVKLLAELNTMRVDLKEVQKRAQQMESILGISGKYLPTNLAREKLAKAVADYDIIEEKHLQEMEKLREIIQCQQKDNQDALSQLEGTNRNVFNN